VPRGEFDDPANRLAVTVYVPILRYPPRADGWRVHEIVAKPQKRVLFNGQTASGSGFCSLRMVRSRRSDVIRLTDRVQLALARSTTAYGLAFDERKDIAIVKIQASSSQIELGNSNELQVGESVIAIAATGLRDRTAES